MNNKIAELIRSAGLEWCAQQEQDKQNLEDFAKLIIAECEKIIGHYNGKYYATLTDAIKKHFGIEDA